MNFIFRGPEARESLFIHGSAMSSSFRWQAGCGGVSASFPGMLFAGLAPLHRVQEALFKGGEFWIGFTNCIVGALLRVIDELISFVEAHLDLTFRAT